MNDRRISFLGNWAMAYGRGFQKRMKTDLFFILLYTSTRISIWFYITIPKLHYLFISFRFSTSNWTFVSCLTDCRDVYHRTTVVSLTRLQWYQPMTLLVMYSPTNLIWSRSISLKRGGGHQPGFSRLVELKHTFTRCVCNISQYIQSRHLYETWTTHYFKVLKVKDLHVVYTSKSQLQFPGNSPGRPPRDTSRGNFHRPALPSIAKFKHGRA